MSTEVLLGVFSLGLLLFQGTATLILLSRLLKGAMRRLPLTPQVSTPDMLGQVSVIVPTLNEVERIEPCLQGLSQQSYEVREILIVDSNSQDGTREKVSAIAQRDPRFRLMSDQPLPKGWIGRPWALHNGFLASSPKSTWLLGIDADTHPQPGLVAALLHTAETEGYDLLSLSPQFILESAGEWWLQPALLMTLIYRFDSAGVKAQSPESVMANGQCFLVRREVMRALNGYSCAASSFCDDVTLARHAAKEGYKVAFLDGAKVLKVRMYEGFKDTWNGWGRSLDLKDASSTAQLWTDISLLVLTQGLPLILTTVFAYCLHLGYKFPTLKFAFGLNLGLIMMRFALLLAIAPSYTPKTKPSLAAGFFWLSPFADTLAVLRIILSATQTHIHWRGRTYGN